MELRYAGAETSFTLAADGARLPVLETAFDSGSEVGSVVAYGQFFNTVIEFLVIAFTIFLLVRQINKWRGTAPAKT